MTDPLMTDTVTVYNRLPPAVINGIPQRAKYNRTVIKNVMWKDRTQHNADGNGITKINKTVSVTIPLEADTGGKRFVLPSEYPKFPAAEVWTLLVDQSNPDIIVKGECDKEVTDSYTVENLKKDYNAMAIQAVSDSHDQDVLPQWKIQGI
jgi:hypothetical protein